MDLSVLLGQIVAIYLVVGGLSVLLNGNEIRGFLKELKHNHLTYYYGGFLSLIIGALMVLTHNVWEGWPIIVTIFGWLTLVKGVLILLLPKQLLGVVHVWKNKQALMVAGVIMLALGVWLGFLAF